MSRLHPCHRSDPAHSGTLTRFPPTRSHRRCPLALLLLALLLPCQAPARTLVVATTGNDTQATGEPTHPFRTLLAALDQATRGDVVEVREGTYRETGEIRIRTPGITLRAHPGHRVILEAPLDNEDSHAACVWLDPDADDTTLSGLEITGGYYYGITLETKWDWGDPADRSGACRVTVEDCLIHHTGRDAIKIKPNCDDILIRRCEIHHTGVGPANQVDPNAEGIDCVNGDRVVVQDCLLHDIHSSGIYLKGGSTDSLVERCHVSRCGEGGILLGFDTSPEFFDRTTNPALHENIRGTVRNCVIRQTGWEGIGLYAALQPRILDNTLVDVCRSNIHAAVYFGLTYQDWEPDAGRPPTTQPVIHGNLVLQPPGTRSPMVEIRSSDDLGGLRGLAGTPDMDHNGFFHADGSPAAFTDLRPLSGSNPDSEPALDRAGIAAWRNQVGADLHSLDADPVLLAHYAFGIPPGQPLPRVQLATHDTPDPRLTLRLPRDPARTEVRVQIQGADQLSGPWQTLAESAGGHPYTGPAAGGETTGPSTPWRQAEVRDPSRSPRSPQRFLRLQVGWSP